MSSELERTDRYVRTLVLYARDTVDENIFRDYDWDEQLSMADVTHLTWDPDGEWTSGDWDPEVSFDECVREVTAEERPTPKSDRPVSNVENLTVGDVYVGPREGHRSSLDSDGRPFEGGPESRRYIRNEDAVAVAEYVHRWKWGGTVIVNEANHALMISVSVALAGVSSYPPCNRPLDIHSQRSQNAVEVAESCCPFRSTNENVKSKTGRRGLLEGDLGVHL